MIRTHFDTTFSGSFGYLVIAVDQHDWLLVINPAVVMDQPVWMQQHLSNQLFAMADDMPPDELAKIIDLVKAREVRRQSTTHDCPASTSLIATDQ